MRRQHQILALAVFAMFSVSAALANDLKIIVNPSVSVSALSGDDIKRVFLGTKTSFDDGTRAQPVLEKGGAAHEEFLRKYLGKTTAALETYYRSLVFTGKGEIPKSFASDAEVAAYVARTKGAIGYVSAGTSTPGVKTIEVR